MNYQMKLKVDSFINMINTNKNSSRYAVEARKKKEKGKVDYSLTVVQMRKNISTEEIEISTIFYDPTDVLSFAKAMGIGCYIGARRDPESTYENYPEINLY